jgi:ABC-type maltose transport system permease subunit
MKTLIALALSVLLIVSPIAALIALMVALVTVNLDLAVIAGCVLIAYAGMIYVMSGFLDSVRRDIEKPQNLRCISKRKEPS